MESELAALHREDFKVTVVPVWPRGKLRLTQQEISFLQLNKWSPNIFRFISNFAYLFYENRRNCARTPIQTLTRILRESLAGAYADQLAKLVHSHNFDHIHAYWASGPSMLAMQSAEIADVKWSLSGHSGDLIEGLSLGKKFKAAAGTRFISKRNLDAIIEQGYALSNARVIHLGVILPELAVTTSVSSCFRMVCVGNLIPIKSHETLFHSIALAGSTGLRLSIEIVGSGYLLDRLKLLAIRLNIADSVIFLGQIPHHELMNKYSIGYYHLAILSSVTDASGQEEGIPISLMEAMSFGIPIISTESGGIPELVPRNLDLLVPKGDSQAMASKILAVSKLSDRGRNLLGGECRKKVSSQFNIAETASELRIWLQEIG